MYSLKVWIYNVEHFSVSGASGKLEKKLKLRMDKKRLQNQEKKDHITLYEKIVQKFKTIVYYQEKWILSIFLFDISKGLFKIRVCDE